MAEDDDDDVDDDDDRPELWEHPPPRPRRWRTGGTPRVRQTVGDDSSTVSTSSVPTMPTTTVYPWREMDDDDDEDEDEDEDVVYELDAAWAARFAATEKMRAARAKERARQRSGGGGRGGRGGREGNATAMGRAPRAEEAATRAEALMRRRRVGGGGGGDDAEEDAEEDVGSAALARARKVELYGEVGAIEVGRLEAELNAAFDAWIDAGDAAYFPTAI